MKDGSIKLDASAALFCSIVSCSKLMSSIKGTAVLTFSAAHTHSKRKAVLLAVYNYTLVAMWML